MGAIFRDKKKTKLLQWNKYSVLYKYDRYNVDTETVSAKSVAVNSLNGDNIGDTAYKYSYATSGTTLTRLNTYVFSSYTLYPGTYSNGSLINSGYHPTNKNDYIYDDSTMLKNFKNGDTTYKYISGAGVWNNSSCSYVNKVYEIVKVENAGYYYGSVEYDYRFTCKIVALCEVQYETQQVKGSRIDTISASGKYYPNDGIQGSYWYTYNGTSKGSLIETVSAKEGTYPDNGIQGGYWYVLVS